MCRQSFSLCTPSMRAGSIINHGTPCTIPSCLRRGSSIAGGIPWALCARDKNVFRSMTRQTRVTTTENSKPPCSGRGCLQRLRNKMSPCKVIQESHAACKGEFRLNSLLTGLLFFLRFAEFPENANQMRRVLLPGIMFHEVATLVHLIESSKPEARVEGIRLIVLLEVP